MKKALLKYTLGLKVTEWIVGQTRLFLTRLGFYSRPAFFIIGAQKCGTSALYNYLCEHPDVLPGRTKEIHFFNRDKRYFGLGINYYHSQFPLPSQLGEYGVTFDATPVYIYCPECPKRIYNYSPRAKMILLLRDPVERAFSAWNMFRKVHEKRRSPFLSEWSSINAPQKEGFRRLFNRKKYPSFEDAINEEINNILGEDTLPEPSFVRRGLYASQLERYYRYFHREQIMIIDSRQLRKETNRTLERISTFIELRPYDWKQGESKRRLGFEGDYKAPISRKAHDYLVEFYRPYNERLYELIGSNFGW